MSPKIWCFGDSWAYGSELKEGEYPFVHWISKEYDYEYENLGSPGSSLGIILHILTKVIHKINSSDIVLFVIPPDSRWYDEDNGKFYNLTAYDFHTNDFMKTTWVGNKTTEWFRYHHALFIYTIQKILNDIGCQYILSHNYGELEYEKYHLKIDKNKFLSTKSLAKLLQGDIGKWYNYSQKLGLTFGPPPKYFKGPFFEGTINHPNENGHKEIARMFLEKLKKNN